MKCAIHSTSFTSQLKIVNPRGASSSSIDGSQQICHHPGHFGKRLKLTHRCFDDHQFKDSRQIHRGKLFMQNIRNALVLLKISGKRTNLTRRSRPPLENTMGRPGEEYPGNEHVGVKEDSHVRPRALATASSISELRAFFRTDIFP